MKGNKELKVKQVAKKLGINERTVYRYIKSKKLRATRIGYWRVEEKELKDFIKRSSNI